MVNLISVCLQRHGLEVWNRELFDGSYALAFVSQRDDGTPYAANFTNVEMGLPKQAYLVQVSTNKITRYKQCFMHSN